MDALSEDSIVTRAHQCWSINEIVVMIVSHLLAANLHGSASALARTSRSLFLSTVPELWREQRSVRALLRLVPQEVFRALRNYMKATSRYWTVSPPKVSGDWARFDWYASCIWVLGQAPVHYSSIAENRTGDVIDHRGLAYVLEDRRIEHGPLVPNLRHFYFPVDIQAIDHNCYITLLLPKSIARIEFHCGLTEALLIFKSLRHIASSIQYLGVAASENRTYLHCPQLENAACALLRSTRSLEILSWSFDLPHSTLLHLATLSGLVKLYLRLPSKAEIMFSGTLLPSAAFPVLRVLAISSHKVDGMCSFLRCIKTAPLCAVQLDVDSLRSELKPDCTSVITELTRNHSRTLTHLELHADRPIWSRRPRPLELTNPFLNMAPLHPVDAGDVRRSGSLMLRSLVISHDQFSDDALRTLAFSSLQLLDIVPIITTILTLRSLLILAENFPRLERLTIFFEAIDAELDHHARMGALVDLNVTTSRIKDAHEVSVFLKSLCPLLTSVDYTSGTDHEGKWREVSQYLASGDL